MSTIFSGTPGRVARIDDPVAQATVPMKIGEAGLHPSYDVHRSLVTRIGCSMGVNAQALHAFADTVYVYVFGDRMTQILISGLSVNGCPDGSPASGEHGVASMMEWWQDNKASARSTPVPIVIGARVLRSILLDMNFDVMDAEHGLVSWAATFRGLPPRS